MALIAVCGCDDRDARSPAIKTVSYAAILDEIVRLYHGWRCDATVRRKHKKQDPGPMTSVFSLPRRGATRAPHTTHSHMSFLSFIPYFPEAFVISQGFRYLLPDLLLFFFFFWVWTTFPVVEY